MEQQLIAVLQQVQSGKITDRNFPNFKPDVFPMLLDVREISKVRRFHKDYSTFFVKEMLTIL